MRELKGTKLVEIPYMINQMTDNSKSVLIIGERMGGEGVSESILDKGFSNVTTTDIVPVKKDSWLDTNCKHWKHIEADFVEFPETETYDFVVSISVFEHFGFWFGGNRMANGLSDTDLCRWNHDIRGINKACRLLKDSDSKLIIAIPAGPYMNYEPSGEPFLRSYDYIRQKLVRDEIASNGFIIDNEKFFYSSNFHEWMEAGPEINHPGNYSYYNPYTPNVIWGLTIKRG